MRNINNTTSRCSVFTNWPHLSLGSSYTRSVQVSNYNKKTFITFWLEGDGSDSEMTKDKLEQTRILLHFSFELAFNLTGWKKRWKRCKVSQRKLLCDSDLRKQSVGVVTLSVLYQISDVCPFLHHTHTHTLSSSLILPLLRPPAALYTARKPL